MVDLDRIKKKEYWSPREATLVLGRNRSFWARNFDFGLVDGYTHQSPGGRLYRHIKADSARRFLESQQKVSPIPPPPDNGDTMKKFRNAIGG